jgi:phage-related protein
MSIGLYGFGKTVTLTAGAAQRITLNNNPGETQSWNSYYANRCTVYNTGSNALVALVNCTSGDFATLSADAITISPSSNFTFVGDGRPPIYAVCLVSASGTTANIGAM